MSDEPPNPQPDPLPSRHRGGPFGRLFSARPQGSPYPKAELLPRALARLTDLILASFLPLTTGRPGVVLAVLFLLFADGLWPGQSPGKRLLGIKAVHLASGRDLDFRESALRNFPLALPPLLLGVPHWGNLLWFAVAPAVLLAEGWMVLRDKLGLRVGDLVAETQVVDAKALVGQQVLPPVLKVIRSDGRASGAARVIAETRPPIS